MATLTTQSIDLDGVAPTYASAAGGGDKMRPGDHNFLHVKNGDGSPITVTLITPGTSEGLAIADQTVTVAATGEQMIRVTPERYRNPSDGLASITYSAVTSVTVAAFGV